MTVTRTPRVSKSSRSRKQRIRRVVLLILGILVAFVVISATTMLLLWGPDRPEQYEDKVADLEERLMDPAPQGVVLLTGSSFFEMWETSAEDLDGIDTVNVGISGTKIGDQIHYLDRLVFPFAPRALVVYAGSNDISGFPFFSKTADQVVPRVQEYVSLVHEEYPGLPIYYVAITEAPIRETVRPEIQAANRMLSTWAEETGAITFIDTAPTLLTPDGGIDESIFLDDRLHFNERGYEKFASAIRDALLPDLGE